MVHNGVEYGMMAAIAEGLSIIEHADVGLHQQEFDAETTPLREPEAYQYEIDVADVAEVWRRGSVVSSWPHRPDVRGVRQVAGPGRLQRARVGLRRGPVDGWRASMRGCPCR